MQTQLIDVVQGKRRCITVVGDDAQSIYAFRGALPSPDFLFGPCWHLLCCDCLAARTPCCSCNKARAVQT